MPPRLSDSKIDSIRELHSRGLFDCEIADRLGIATCTVWHYRSSVLGLSPRLQGMKDFKRRAGRARDTIVERYGSMGRLRLLNSKIRAALSLGWIEVTFPEAVILDVLFAEGPQSLSQISRYATEKRRRSGFKPYRVMESWLVRVLWRMKNRGMVNFTSSANYRNGSAIIDEWYLERGIAKSARTNRLGGDCKSSGESETLHKGRV